MDNQSITMIQVQSLLRLVLVLILHCGAAAFVPQKATTTKATTTASTTTLYNTGGWGVGPQRDISDLEYSRSGKVFTGYQLQNRGDFLRNVKDAQEQLELGELDELLGVAASAGIAVPDPKVRRAQFALDNDDLEDQLDLSIPDDTDEMDDTVVSEKAATVVDDSITRMDEDTGASGVW